MERSWHLMRTRDAAILEAAGGSQCGGASARCVAIGSLVTGGLGRQDGNAARVAWHGSGGGAERHRVAVGGTDAPLPTGATRGRRYYKQDIRPAFDDVQWRLVRGWIGGYDSVTGHTLSGARNRNCVCTAWRPRAGHCMVLHRFLDGRNRLRHRAGIVVGLPPVKRRQCSSLLGAPRLAVGHTRQPGSA